MYPLEDTRVLHTHHGWQVLAQQYEVMWRDGSAVQLHPVLLQGVPATFVRAFVHEARWVLTDLRHHSPEIQADVLRVQPRDTPGIVYYTLRHGYPSAQAFVRSAWLAALASWWHADACTARPPLRLVA